MNELKDLYTPPEEFFCGLCNRPYNLRSGYKSHMRNTHNQDEYGNAIDKKKTAKRRTVKNNEKAAAGQSTESDAKKEGTVKNNEKSAAGQSKDAEQEGKIKNTISDVNEVINNESSCNDHAGTVKNNENAAAVQSTDAEKEAGERVDETAGAVEAEERMVVGDEDLGGGYVFADEDIWAMYNFYHGIT